MNIQEYLKVTTKFLPDWNRLENRPHITCLDGFKMSVQASNFHYCNPREDLMDGEYDEVEIGFPSQKEDLIMEYAECPDEPTDTVYGWVPVEIVNEVIEKHGGIINQI